MTKRISFASCLALALASQLIASDYYAAPAGVHIERVDEILWPVEAGDAQQGAAAVRGHIDLLLTG